MLFGWPTLQSTTHQLPDHMSESSEESIHAECPPVAQSSDSDTSDTESSLSGHSATTDADSDSNVNNNVSYAHAVTNHAPVIADSLKPIRSRVFHSSNNSSHSGLNNQNVVTNKRQSRRQTIPQTKGWNKPSDQLNRTNQNCTIQGSSTAPGLHTINRQRDRSSTATNKSCTGVFITRLKPHTSISNIEAYVRQELGLSIKAEKLPTKFNTYSSFYIPCDGRIRSKLIDGSIWPYGSLIKPFYS